MKTFWLVALLVFGGTGAAQLEYRGSLELGLDTALSPALPVPQAGWTLSGNVTAEYDLEPGLLTPALLSAVLDPSVRADRRGLTLEPGLTEAYVLTAQPDYDLSAGVERLPLETARLSIPFGVEGTNARGVRQGVPGTRVSYYLDDWRVRGAVFYQDALATVTPLVSVRRSFGDFELEAHALYPREVVLGLGGSGLVAELVLYGEAWLLSDPLGGRGAVGLSGYLDVGTWTLEAAYLSPGEASLKDDSDAETQRLSPAQADPSGARPAVLGQIAWPLGEAGDRSVSFFGGTFFDPDAVRSQVSASYTVTASENELSLTTGGLFGPEPLSVTLSLGFRQFF